MVFFCVYHQNIPLSIASIASISCCNPFRQKNLPRMRLWDALDLLSSLTLNPGDVWEIPLNS